MGARGLQPEAAGELPFHSVVGGELEGPEVHPWAAGELPFHSVVGGELEGPEVHPWAAGVAAGFGSAVVAAR